MTGECGSPSLSVWAWCLRCTATHWRGRVPVDIQMMKRQAKATGRRSVIALWAMARCRYTVVTTKEIWTVTSPIRTASRTATTRTSLTLEQARTPHDCARCPERAAPAACNPVCRTDPRHNVRLLATIRDEVSFHELHAL